MLMGAGAMINLIARTVRRGANWFGRRRLDGPFRPGKDRTDSVSKRRRELCVF